MGTLTLLKLSPPIRDASRRGGAPLRLSSLVDGVVRGGLG